MANLEPFDLESRELIHGPPDKILTYDDFEIYQIWMGKKCRDMPYLYLGADMGLGKTATSLWAAKQWLEKGICKKILIIAPLNVANYTWPDEIAKWDFARSMRFSVITGTTEEREKALKRNVEIHIINRENFVWLYNYLPGRAFDYDGLIYDEASRLKAGNKKTKPTERKDGTLSTPKISEFGALRRVRFKFNRFVQLSGTPAPNGLIDLWGPMYLLDKGKRLGSSKSSFFSRWFSYDKWTYSHSPFPHSKDQILDAIKDIFFTLKSSDYIKLPPLKVVDRWVTLSPKTMKYYQELKKEMALEQYDIEAVNKGVLVNKLLQFANGSVYNDDSRPVKMHDEKLKELESIYVEAGGKPIMVAYSFEFDKDAIYKKFKGRGARIFGESGSDMRDWNAGKIPMLILHPASAGHGLNFQYGSNIAVWYGLNWSLELYQQFVKRLHRRGQKGLVVFMYRILARNTFDGEQALSLESKEANQDEIIAAGKAHIEAGT